MASQWKDLVSGMSGGVGLVLAGHPLDTVKVRLQTQGHPPVFNGAIDCFMKTLRLEGIRGGLYKGVASPLLGVPPIYAVVFTAYGFSRDVLLRYQAGSELTLRNVFLAGCATGVASTVVTTPVELLKSRLQIEYNQRDKPRYTTLRECAAYTMQREGMKGLFRGTVVTLWRDIPGTGVWYLSYEAVKRALRSEDGSVGVVSLFLGGCAAGIGNWLAIYPIDVIKSRMQTDLDGKYKAGVRGMWAAGIECYKAGALFKGISPALMRAIPANGSLFLVQGLVMNMLEKI